MSYGKGLEVLGAGGGHGRGGHSGGHRRGGGWRGRGFYGGGYPRPYGYYLTDDTDCDFFGPHGECVILGAEAGYDIVAVNKSVRGTKPMSVKQAHRFNALAMESLANADKFDTGEGASLRRVNLGRQVRNIDAMIDSYHLDPLPEAAAEILRNAFLAAIAEFNAVAEGKETLKDARRQLFQDILDNAKAVSLETGNTLKWALWIGAGAAGLAVIGVASQYLLPKRRA